MIVKYHDAVPIYPRQHTVWVIELSSGERRIAIWAKDATIENVHHFYKVRGLKFKLGQLGVGEHVIEKTDHSYMDDERFVDQDWNISLRVDDK